MDRDPVTVINDLQNHTRVFTKNLDRDIRLVLMRGGFQCIVEQSLQSPEELMRAALNAHIVSGIDNLDGDT